MKKFLMLVALISAFQLALCQNIINVKAFGVMGDGTTDDSNGIQAAINSAEQKGATIFFPPGTYVVKHQILLKNSPLRGVYNQSTLLVKDDFTFSEKIDGRDYSIFLNTNFQGSKTHYANKIKLTDLNFEYAAATTNAGKQANLLGLANVVSGSIDSCNFKVDANCGAAVTALDLWASVANFNITDCNVAIYNQQKAGGCIWISNITTNGYNHNNDTYNIVVNRCHLLTASKDEALAVFGVRGTSRNIDILNCAFVALPSSQRHSVLVSVFPLNDNSANGQSAAVKNVTVEHCEFHDDYFSNHVLRIGQDADKNQVCDSVFILHNKFFVSKKIQEISFIARNIKCVGDNVVFAGNNLEMRPGSAQINYAIAGFDIVSDNKISGSFDSVISGANHVSKNDFRNAKGKQCNSCKDFRN